MLKRLLILSALFCLVTGLNLAAVKNVQAENISSIYSKLDYENGCIWDAAASEEEGQMGGSAVCEGIDGHPVYFAEGDLRQFTAYGPVEDPMTFPNGFSEWN